MSNPEHTRNGHESNTVLELRTQMKILILGKNGQVGRELEQFLAKSTEVIALSRNDKGGDLTNIKEMVEFITQYQPDIIFNAAAYTAVDKAESEFCIADLVNHQAVEALASVCAKTNALLVHYSTDYVFDGSGNTPRSETSIPNPINTYGKTKLNGEISISKSNCKALIFRTSWVYASHGKNFIKTIIRLSKDREELKVVDDQIGAPTSASFIASASAELALRARNREHDLIGTYNLVPNGTVSWYGLAEHVISYLRKNQGINMKVRKILPIPSMDFPTPAKRPLNSRLDNQKLSKVLKNNILNWETYVDAVLDELIKQERTHE